jgi:site-specific DNA-adenine methylase
MSALHVNIDEKSREFLQNQHHGFTAFAVRKFLEMLMECNERGGKQAVYTAIDKLPSLLEDL